MAAPRPASARSARRRTIYVRTDTDDTTVVSPTVNVSGQATDQVALAAGYTVDAWTGASVDVVTAATKAISERRNEGQVGLAYDNGTTRLNTRYRVSYEHDYESHGFVLGASRDFARHNTTVSANLMGSRDLAGRSGDPGFAELMISGGGRLGLSQVIDARTVIDVAWETMVLSGYQASPYRWVAVGGLGTCASDAPFCVPEQVPELRVRNAASARLRHALGERASIGLDYRYYLDSWGIRSHTVEPSLSWVPSDATTLTLHYRYYAQGEATFYRPRYFDFADGGGYLTRDRKLSAFLAHEVGAALGRTWEFDDGERHVDLGLRASLSRIEYLAYVGLESVDALEVTTMFGLDF
ncbi:MAG: DUF3570 domain-containing protein [Myxococcales bacterium]|nr:DUF3570 domain-containing protein [Myxococcales bacterium]